MAKRLYFICWNCKRYFSIFKDITSQQKLVVPCPFCEKKCLVNLPTYRQKVKTIIRGDEVADSDEMYEYIFPDKIPTEPVDDLED